jgi:hypothetical protein
MSLSNQVRNGLAWSYYTGYFADNVNFFTGATPVTSGVVTSIPSINSGTGGYVPADGSWSTYSVQWLGYFLSNYTGTWTFYTNSDDASYLWIGPTATSGFTTTNAIVINGGTHPMTEKSGTVSLVAGQYYPIRIQFGENGGGDNIIVSFSNPGLAKTTNGQGFFFTAPSTVIFTGLQPKIFLGPLLSYPTSTGTPPTNDGTKLSFARASSQYLNFGPQTFDMSKGFSATCRFAFIGTAVSYERIFDFGKGQGNDNLILCRNVSTSRVSFYFLNGAAEYLVTSTNSVAQGQINTVTAIYNASPLSITIILNGVQTSVTPAAAATTPRALSLCYVGRSNWTSDPYPNIDIYSLNIYNRVLTPNELSGPPAPIPRGIFKYNYPLDLATSVIGAYSFRKLIGSYQGPMIRLRRQSDLTDMDFVGDNFGKLSNVQTGLTASAWIGGSSANVLTWYDQSSASNHAPYTADNVYGLPPPFSLTNGIYFQNQNFTTSTTYYYGLKLGTAKTIQACLCNFNLKSGKTTDIFWNSLVAASNDNAGVRLNGNPGALNIGDGNDFLTTGCYTIFDGIYNSPTSGKFFINSFDVPHKMFADRTVGQYVWQMLYIGTANPTGNLKSRSFYGHMSELVLFSGSVNSSTALTYMV